MMKKKMLALLMAAALTLGICVPAFGVSGANGNSGSITIENAVDGQAYSVYQILQLESYNADGGAYAYKATEAWKEFVSSDGVKDKYLTVGEGGYVSWVSADEFEGVSEEEVEAAEQARVAAFAKLAQAYAKEKKLAPSADPVVAGSAEVKFEGLNLGYYLVDTTLGTICSLDTTDPSVTMREKNAAPENAKQVQEDSKVADPSKGWGSWNDADISQEVKFQSTITAQAGAENYVFHDKMSEGLTFKAVTGVALNGSEVSSEKYAVVKDGLSDNCTFEVAFTQTFCDTLKADDKIVVSYIATLNENAVVGLPGNPNESYLSYGEYSGSTTGEPSRTPSSETVTYTWDMDVLKYANGDESKVLQDAQFVLLNSAKTKVATVVDGKLTSWADVPTTGDDGVVTWPDGTVLTTNESGKIEIDGLDSDTYHLREVKAPAGYNMLAKDVEVKIAGATEAEDSGVLSYSTVVAKVNNQSGIELPSTGGMGTTLFYIVGGVLVAGAAVLLVVRRRSAGSEE